MASDPTWPVVGIDCMCLYQGPWLSITQKTVDLGFGVAVIEEYVEGDGPKFMHVYKIRDVQFLEDRRPGHRVHLNFSEYPSDWYCACKFTPLEKLSEGEELARELHSDLSPGQRIPEPTT